MVLKERLISEPEKVCRLQIRSTVLLNNISNMTNDFFITHTRSVDENEWSELIDRIIDAVNTQRG